MNVSSLLLLNSHVPRHPIPILKAVTRDSIGNIPDFSRDELASGMRYELSSSIPTGCVGMATEGVVRARVAAGGAGARVAAGGAGGTRTEAWHEMAGLIT